MSDQRLVMMANQIARFFAAQPSDKAVAGISDHLVKFWNPVMIRDLKEKIDQGETQADPLVIAALARISDVDRKAGRQSL